MADVTAMLQKPLCGNQMNLATLKASVFDRAITGNERTWALQFEKLRAGDKKTVEAKWFVKEKWQS